MPSCHSRTARPGVRVSQSRVLCTEGAEHTEAAPEEDLGDHCVCVCGVGGLAVVRRDCGVTCPQHVTRGNCASIDLSASCSR